MTPDEVLTSLEAKYGITISRRTLLRYESLELIPIPTRGGLGRGKGRTTDYPLETVEKAHAAYLTLNGHLTGEPSAYMVVAILRDKFPDMYDEIKTKIHKNGGKANAKT